MSDDTNRPDPSTPATLTLTDDQIVAERSIGRRPLLVGLGISVLGAAATALNGCETSAAAQPPPPPPGSAGGSIIVQPGVVMAQPVQPQGTGVTDSDPQDPPGGGHGYAPGVSDSDPQDPAGHGRGGPQYAQPVPQGTGVTDSDPNDPAGGGRGGQVYQPAPVQTGTTDQDPQDPPGGGRGYQSGMTDSDPQDPPGRGRRGR